MRSRRILRIAGLVLAGILLLIVAVVVSLHTPPVRQYALRQVIGLLDSRGIALDAASLDYNLLDLSVALDDVVIRSNQARDLPPFAVVDRVTADLSLTDLLGGAYVIEQAALENAAVHYVMAEGGRSNLPAPTPSGEAGGQVDFFLKQLRATNGSLTFEHRGSGATVRLPQWRLTVDGRRETSAYDVRYETTQPGQALMDGRTLPIEELSAQASADRQRVELKKLRLRTAKSEIAAAGAVNLAGANDVDLKLTGDLALEPLLTFAGVNRKVAGVLKLRAEAGGTLPQATVRANLRGDDLTVDRFKRIDIAADAVYRRAQDRVTVESFTLDSPAGELRGEALLALEPEAGESRLDGRLRALELQLANSFADLPFTIASRATGTVRATWPALGFAQAQGAADLRLRATADRAREDVLPVTGNLTVRYRRGDLTVDVASLEALSASSQGRVTLAGGKRLGGAMRVKAPELGQTVTRLQQLLGRENIVGAGMGGSGTVVAKLGGTMDNPVINIEFETPGIRLGELLGRRD